MDKPLPGSAQPGKESGEPTLPFSRMKKAVLLQILKMLKRQYMTYEQLLPIN